MRDSYRCPLFFPVFLRPAGIARAEAQAGLLLQAVDEGRGAEGTAQGGGVAEHGQIGGGIGVAEILPPGCRGPAGGPGRGE